MHPFKKHSLLPITAAAFLAAGLVLPLRAADVPAGFVDFGKLAPPGAGGQFVEVNVQSSLIGLAVKLVEKEEPEVAELLRGLKSVRVNVVGVDDTNREALASRIQQVRNDLDTKGWERVVTVQEKKDDVAIYLKHRGDEAIEGVVVLVIGSGKEAVFINVVGDIRPEKIADLAEHLNIAPLKQAAAAIGKS